MNRLRSLVSRFGAELLALLFGAALTFDRLLGLPGAESSLFLGALFSPIVAITIALDERESERFGPVSLALMRAAGLFFLAIIPLYLHALFVPFCAPQEGALFLAFGAFPGFLLAALIGLVARLYLKRRAYRVLFTLAFTLGSIVVGVLEFFFTPGIAIFGEFGGYLPGTFYETGREFPVEFLSFRLGSFFAALALLGVIGWRRLPARRLEQGLLLTIGLVGFIIVRAYGEELDHRTSAAKIDERLGGLIESERCRLHYPRELRPDLRALHLEECERFLSYAEKALELASEKEKPQREKIDVYFYRSAHEKRRLMGAGQIQLAKPWRDEVHLVIRSFPHPVLAHELAHIVGARISDGIFGVPGALFGLIPNAGLIEGFAVALAFDEARELDPHQASRALLELGRLPPLGDLTSLAFIRHPASNAYAAAGSFLRFILDTEGAGALKSVYRESSLAPLHKSVDALEEAFHTFLRGVALPEGALELAEARYSRPSVFHASCPHETSKMRSQLGLDRAAGDFEAMLATAEEILAIEPADLTARIERIRALALSGAIPEARAAHDELVSLNYPAPIVARSHSILGDAEWLRGNQAAAKEELLAALELPTSEDERRNHLLRLYALEQGGAIEASLRELFLGDDGRGSDSIRIMNLTRALEEAGEGALSAYLAARQLYHREFYRETLERLRADLGPLPAEEFERERLRMRLHSLIAIGELEPARALAESLKDQPSFSSAIAAFRSWLGE